MGGKSTIEWTDATWNPVTGCTKIREVYTKVTVGKVGLFFNFVLLCGRFIFV